MNLSLLRLLACGLSIYILIIRHLYVLIGTHYSNITYFECYRSIDIAIAAAQRVIDRHTRTSKKKTHTHKTSCSLEAHIEFHTSFSFSLSGNQVLIEILLVAANF